MTAVSLRPAYRPEELATVAVHDQVEIWHPNMGRHVWASVLEVSLQETRRHNGSVYVSGAEVTVAFQSWERVRGVRVVTLDARAYSTDIRQCYTPPTPVYSAGERDHLMTALVMREHREPNVLVEDLPAK